MLNSAPRLGDEGVVSNLESIGLASLIAGESDEGREATRIILGEGIVGVPRAGAATTVTAALGRIEPSLLVVPVPAVVDCAGVIDATVDGLPSAARALVANPPAPMSHAMGSCGSEHGRKSAGGDFPATLAACEPGDIC